MKPDPFAFSAMTMNLRFGLARDRGNCWENRKAVVADILKNNVSDFMGFQEVNHFQAEFLGDVLQDHRCIGRYNPHLPWWQSNMIFYHKDWTCLAHRHHFISDFPDLPSKLKGSRWPRQCVIGWFEKRGQHVLAATTHFDFAADVQAKSAGLVANFLEQFPRDLPTVITGDFNADHESGAFKTFAAHGFQEVCQNKPLGTFHGFSGEAENHIDWILYRGDIHPDGADIIRAHQGGQYPSDHFPVRTVFVRQAAKKNKAGSTGEVPAVL
jgi:endonuclease/exonuclease/phosphatase family metal-dependent hydrolase